MISKLSLNWERMTGEACVAVRMMGLLVVDIRLLTVDMKPSSHSSNTISICKKIKVLFNHFFYILLKIQTFELPWGVDENIPCNYCHTNVMEILLYVLHNVNIAYIHYEWQMQTTYIFKENNRNTFHLAWVFAMWWSASHLAVFCLFEKEKGPSQCKYTCHYSIY